jgi:MFS family permease
MLLYFFVISQHTGIKLIKLSQGVFRLFLPWTIWALATLTYFHQYYLRFSVGSLSKHLMQDFFLTIVDMSNLAVLFFISYVATLPIAGILLDRFGVKKILPLAMIIAGVSCFIFAWSHSNTQLIIARILMGFSASFSLIATLTVIRQFFRSGIFPILSGLTMSIGVLGGALGGGPLVSASDVEDWRRLMGYAGWYAFIVAILFYFISGEKQRDNIQQVDIKKAFFHDLKIFLRQWQNWLPGAYGGFVLTPIVAFAGFWAAPFLSIHYQVGFNRAEYLTSFIFMGYAAGAPASALLADKFGLKTMMVFFASLAAIIMLLLINFILPIPWVIVCLFLQGVAVGSFVLSTLAIKLITAPNIAASAFSFNTMLSQLVGAVSLWCVGQFIYLRHGVEWLHNQQNYSPIVLQDSMYIFFGGSCLAILCAFLIKLPKNFLENNEYKS